MNYDRELLDTVMNEMPFGFGWNFQTFNPGVHSFLFLIHMYLSLFFIIIVYQTVDASASFFFKFVYSTRDEPFRRSSLAVEVCRKGRRGDGSFGEILKRLHVVNVHTRILLHLHVDIIV